uniref:High-affinity choline transporter 1-like n=1 Tax=Macrostomum lignano TaxID=282301 RepID=A0A1I8G8D8_9PLAT
RHTKRRKLLKTNSIRKHLKRPKLLKTNSIGRHIKRHKLLKTNSIRRHIKRHKLLKTNLIRRHLKRHKLLKERLLTGCKTYSSSVLSDLFCISSGISEHLEDMADIAALISIGAFYLIILVVGLIASRKNNKTASSKTEETMVAGRNIGITVGVFTCTATWVGGGFINGTAESVFEPGQGLVWTQAPVAYSASLLLGGLLFARRMRERRYVTMLDPLQKAFGDRMCALLFLPCLLGELFWSAAILAALGGTVSILVDFSMDWSIVLSAGIAVVYTLFGGLYSVAYTDVAQLIFIFLGLWTVVPFALTHPSVSPLASTAFIWPSSPNSTAQATAKTSTTAATTSGWIGQLQPSDRWRYADSALMLILGGIPWQVYFQRVLSQRTAAGAVAISAASGLAVLLMSLPPVLIGAAAASASNSSQWLIEDCVDSRFILPLALRHLCPRPVAIVGLGAVSAAVMSSADSTVLSSASMFCRNVFKPLVWPKASEGQLVWVLRASILAAGAASAGLAISIRTIYGLWFLCSDLVYVVVLPQLTASLYLPWTNAGGSLAGYLVSLTLRLSAGESLLGLPALVRWPNYQLTGESDTNDFVQQFPVRTVSMLAGFAALMLVSLLSKTTSYGGDRGEDGVNDNQRTGVSKETLTTYL